jgi:hypothetical protein
VFNDLAHVPVFAGVAALLYAFVGTTASPLRRLGGVTGICGLLAVTIELEQLVTGSGLFQLRDLWFDVVGIAIGLVVAGAGLRLWNRSIFTAVVVVGVVASLFLLPEASGSPAFEYASAEVERRCTNDVATEPATRLGDREPLVRYLFDEGDGQVVHDSVGRLDLSVGNSDSVTWVAGGGLSFSGDAPHVRSDEPGTVLSTAVAATDEVTVEVKFTAATLPQTGPVRLVTMSQGPEYGEANVHIGIEGRAISFRVRTDCDDFNWTLSDDVLLAGSRSHVVATYRPGIIAIFVNGLQVVSEAVPRGFLDSWNAGMRLHVADEATADRSFAGTIEEIALYDRAASPADIRILFANDSAG